MSHMGNRIKQLREKHKMTQDELAHKLGYSSRSSINKIEIGRSDLPQSKISLAAKILHTDPAYLLGWEENLKPVEHEFEKIPVYPPLCCGDGYFTEDNIIDYISIPKKMLQPHKKYFANYAMGNSMIEENINDGDLIIFEHTNIINNGDIGCFCIDENEATCKIFKRDHVTSIIMLLPANNDFQPIIITSKHTGFKIIGKLALVINNRQ